MPLAFFVDEDRIVDERRGAADRVEPVQHLPLDRDGDAELGKQLRRPRSGADERARPGWPPMRRNGSAPGW